MDAPICICTRLRRATRGAIRHYDAALRPVGLNVTQFALLRAIERLGEAAIGDLADAIDIDASTLGRNLRVLARQGLVALDPGNDRRTRIVRMTEAGVRTSQTIAPLWAEAQATLDARLGAGGRDALFGLLDRVGDAAS